jgi:hypothetical protein
MIGEFNVRNAAMAISARILWRAAAGDSKRLRLSMHQRRRSAR